MQALNLGLNKTSLFAQPNGNELLYHLRLVPKEKHIEVAQIEIRDIDDTDDCRIYYKNIFITTTSTQELERLIKLATFNTMTMVEVRTNGETYYASIDGDLLKRKYVGVLTDSLGRVTAFVQHIKDTFWAINGERLIQLEYETDQPLIELRAQEGLKYINKYSERFTGQCNEIILFK